MPSRRPRAHRASPDRPQPTPRSRYRPRPRSGAAPARSRSPAASAALAFVATLGVAVLPGGGCTKQVVGRGNPRTLAPLLGGGRVTHIATRPPPKEPVSDYVADVSPLQAAWPSLSYELPRLLRALIARGSWRDVHHAAQVSAGTLRVRHRAEVIAEVRKLVAELKRRLLRRMHVQVAFLQADSKVVDRVFAADGAGVRHWDARRFAAEVKRKRARVLARAMFSSYNGRWARSERLSNRVFVSGVTASSGIIIPRTTTLATGATLQAAAWRWGEQRAVVALTGSYTGQALGAAALKQTVHRSLPAAKVTERRWQPHDVSLELPVRDMVEFQNTLTVDRGRWTVAAVLPATQGRSCAVVVKVDWRPAAATATSKPAAAAAAGAIKPLASDRAFVLRIVPVALPLEQRRPRARPAIYDELRNRASIKQQSAKWFRRRAAKRSAEQKKNTYNFQSVSGALAFGYHRRLAPPSTRTRVYLRRKTESASLRSSRHWSRRHAARARQASPFGALPSKLEQLKSEVIRTRWPAGTAVEFVANHVFVVHRPSVADKVVELLRGIHRWRNQRVVAGVAFPLLDARTANRLAHGTVRREQARKLRGGSTLLPGAYVLGRSDSRAEVFVGQMHSALAGAWAPNTSSPPVVVFWRGARLALLPRLNRGARRSLGLQFKHYRLSKLAPRAVAAAVLQQPVDSTWVHARQLLLGPTDAALTGVSSSPQGLLGLLVHTRWLR